MTQIEKNRCETKGIIISNLNISRFDNHEKYMTGKTENTCQFKPTRMRKTFETNSTSASAVFP